MKTANTTTATVNSWIFTADSITVNGRTFPASYSLAPKGDVYVFVNLKATAEAADLPAVRLHVCANMPMHADAVAAAQAAKQAAKVEPAPVVEAAAPVADPAPVQDAPAPVTEPAPAKKPARKKAATKPEPAPAVEAAAPIADPAPVQDAPATVSEPAPAKKPTRKKAAKKPEPAPAVEAAAPIADPAPVQDAPAPVTEPAPAKAAPVEKPWIGTSITGKGWSIAFDQATGRTRVTVEGTPTDAQRNAIEQAGFFWSAKMASWNKGLTCKAYRAAQSLAAALTALA